MHHREPVDAVSAHAMGRWITAGWVAQSQSCWVWRRASRRKMRLRRVSMEWREEDGGLENCSQNFFSMLCSGCCKQGRADMVLTLNEERLSIPPWPPPSHRQSFDVQHKALPPAPQQGKHEPAGKQDTLHLLTSGSLCCAFQNEHRITSRSQEHLKTSPKAKCSQRSRQLRLQDSPAAPQPGSSSP